MNWDDWGVLIFAAGCIGIGVFAATVAVRADMKQKNDFMAQCLQDRKQYECTAMWRAGESHTAPIFIHTGK